jgi:hypothetical protein
MTVDAFLVWEKRQELRREFDGCVSVAVTGGTAGIQRSSGVSL